MSSGLMRMTASSLEIRPYLGHIHSHAKRGRRCALPGTRLEHVERALFDGELHILHVAVMFLEDGADLFELLVDSGHALRHLGQVHRRADAGNNVFALGIDEEVAVKRLFARARVAGETNARAGVFASVAEDHLHHVDRGTKKRGDFFDCPTATEEINPLRHRSPHRIELVGT